MDELHLKNRRQFIKTTAKAGLALAALNVFPIYSFAKNKEIVKLTILHTNDTHSHIDPFPGNDPKYPNLGGIARRAAIINKIRSETQNVLLLDAGDIFQGTPYFNKYGGKLEFELMSQLQYDVATLGNHDFDNGIEGLRKMLPYAKFPFVNCNYDFSNTSLHNKFKTYKIIEKQGIKIGITGVGVELEGLVAKKNYGNIVYNNPIEKATKIADYLKNEEKCHLVICLSHLGFQYKTKKVSDLHLAEQSKNIDIIIGGHTHTFLDKPVIKKNKDGHKVLITQVGWAGIKLGRIDCEINLFGNNKNYSYRSIKVLKNQY